MKNTKLLIAISLVGLSSFAMAYSDEERKAQEIENMKMLAQQGLPLPGSGINIVPRSMFNLSEAELIEGAKEQEQINSLGYVKKYINAPQELLKMKSVAQQKFKSNKKVEADASTDLRHSVNEIKLAFDYSGLNKNKSLSNKLELIAAVPQGAFHENGWSGVAEFFVDKEIGTCSYAITNVKVANSAAQLAMEDVTYTVNNKATLMKIEGMESSGFLYTIDWYDEDAFHNLECANMKYSPKIKQLVIELAKKID